MVGRFWLIMRLGFLVFVWYPTKTKYDTRTFKRGNWAQISSTDVLSGSKNAWGPAGITLKSNT